MTGLAKVSVALASILYPLIVLTGLIVFKASPRAMSLCLVAVLVLNFLAYSKEARRGGFLLTRLLLTTGCLAALVIIVLITDSLGLVKLYPLVVNGFLLASFLFTLWKPPTMIFRLARLREPVLAVEGPEKNRAEVYCRKVTLVWCGFFLANSIASGITALWASDLVWAIYNGGVAYGLMGLLFAGEWIVRRRVRSR